MIANCLLKFDIRPVPNLLNAYVSSAGDVYLRDRFAKSCMNHRKPYKGKVGYYVVSFRDSSDKRYKPRYVHRMVADMFLPPRSEGQEVRHLDGNKLNNDVSNLAWGTRKQNVEDTRRHGRMPLGAKVIGSILCEDDVRIIRYLLKREASLYSIAGVFKTSVDAIRAIRTGRNWSHIA